jgi:AcrR family transcriptional regulator
LKPKKKSELTRERILRAALAAFRKKGFDVTTMRDIAQAAGTSLGAAYYYFPSKEALVLAHWENQMDEHERRARETFAKSNDASERLRAVFHARLELIRTDRKLLTGLFRTVGDPSSPASVFAKETHGLRERGLALFREALSVDSVAEEVRDEGALLFWLLLLGVLLYFIHDESPKGEKTWRLADGAIDALAPLVPFLAMPEMQPLRARAIDVLREAGLFPVN